MFQEVWKPIKGYEGLYEVSNLGRVRSLDRWVDRGGQPKCALWKGRILKNKKSKTENYYTVILSKDDEQKCVRVHRLVAEAFLPNPDNLPEINHKDENKLNNTVYLNPDGSVDPSKSNLEWCDRHYNMHYGTARERATKTLLKTYQLKRMANTSF